MSTNPQHEEFPHRTHVYDRREQIAIAISWIIVAVLMVASSLAAWFARD